MKPVLNIPHNLPDPILIWPAHPDRGGLDVFLTGVIARAINRLDDHHAWWHEMLHFAVPPA